MERSSGSGFHMAEQMKQGRRKEGSQASKTAVAGIVYAHPMEKK